MTNFFLQIILSRIMQYLLGKAYNICTPVLSRSRTLSLCLYRISESLQQIFSSRAQIRREQLHLERQLKENELRQRYSEEDNLQVQYFCAKEKTEKVADAYAAIHRFHHPRRKTAAESSFHFSVLYSCLSI